MKVFLTALLFVVFLPVSVSHAQERLAPPLAQQANSKPSQNAAEVLNALTRMELQEDGHWSQTFYFSIRLNEANAARDYGRISYPFNHYYTDTELDFANVISATGKASSVSSEAVQLRVTGGGQDFYSDSSELVFSLPDIAPGSVIEFQISQKSKRLTVEGLFSDRVLPYWFQPTVAKDGLRADFVDHFEYQLTYPKSRKIFTQIHNGFPKSKRKASGEKVVETWRLKNVPAIAIESAMPPIHKIAPQLNLSTMTDWSAIDRWSWEQAADKFAPTDQLKALVRSLKLSENASREEKIRAVYEYVQTNIRYVFAHLGRGGYEPHFANEVLKANYGDCKDQAVLAIAMLRMLGVEAYPALVETPQSGKHDTSLVAMIFDHMIVYVPADNDHAQLWLDTTGDRSLYPGVSNYLQGQSALIVDGKGGKLTKIDSGFEKNSVRLAMEYSLNDKGQMVVDARLRFSGLPEQQTRSWWVHDTQRETSLNQYLASLFNAALDYKLTKEVVHADNLWQSVEIGGTFTFAEFSEDEPTVFAASFTQMFQLFGGFGGMQIPDSRKSPYDDPYAYELHMDVRFKGDGTTVPTVINSSDAIKNRFFSLTQKGVAEGDDYRLEIAYQKPGLNLGVADYQEYYNALKTVEKLPSWQISMLPDLRQQEQAELETVKTKHGDKSFAYQLALARHYVEAGRFEQALSPAQQAVTQNNKSGEAWYLLGMAQGFSDMLDDSVVSFERAESLGYLP